MQKALNILILFLSSLIIFSCNRPLTEKEMRAKAKDLSQKFIIIDTHIDAPFRLHREWKNLADSTDRDFDYPKAMAGGLNVPFMAIFVPASTEGSDQSTWMADSMITLVENLATANPDKFKVVNSVQQIRDNVAPGMVCLAMGMENGSPVNNNLANLKHFYDRGIRYITLAHSKWNHICDSSYDEDKHWNGLSPFGEEVVKEMNRLGIMVDISHVSDSAFYDVLKITKAPVIASHSSCRFFTPGFERNLSDEMIKLVANNGGVVQITFGSSFVNNTYRLKMDSLSVVLKEQKLSYWSHDAINIIEKYKKEHHIKFADVSEIAAHIDHVVKIAGIDYVGLGSDFDGVGNTLPTGLKDVSGFPNIIYELLKLGYSDEDIEKVCSGNILRVWSEVENLTEK